MISQLERPCLALGEGETLILPTDVGRDEREFGSLLRRFRKSAALSQEELAERASISVQAVGLLERGLRRAPYRTTVSQICDALSLRWEDRTLLEDAINRRRKKKSFAPHYDVETTGARCQDALPRLIGRKQERAEIAEWLRRDDTNVVTLVGPGGVGKTRLALDLLAATACKLETRATFVDLSPIRNPASVLATIASSVGVNAESSYLAEAVASRLGNEPTLLVLDNAEHVIEQSAEAVAQLSNVSGLTVLATSRTPLHLRNERVVRLNPLSPAEGMQLFIERAQAAGNRDEFDSSDDTLSKIIAHVDGLPLAIELAAACTRIEPIAALSLRLERRLDVLVNGPRDTGERHRTMRAAIAWSYDLCSEEERLVLRALSLFGGGCSPSSAASVLGIPDEREVVGIFLSLFDKSLVIRDGEEDDVLRVTMLQTTREFAAEQLAADPDAPRLRRSFARHFLKLAEEPDSQFAGGVHGRAVDELRERENIRCALALARNEEMQTTLLTGNRVRVA